MISTTAEHKALAQTDELETAVAAIEMRLAHLGEALRERDARAVEGQANELHRALACAVERFTHAARHGGAPQALRLRLARASAQVASQRDALSRATAALDRAIDVLMPEQARGHALYGSHGLHESIPRGGSICA
ncbi:MAG: hypothetical protein L6Q73_02835 [Aquabacterium sp.]|nr:hypothetical protein [Aquabacterium sp.]